MKTILTTDNTYTSKIKALAAASSLFDASIERRVVSIIGAVKERGDDALIEYTERFDGAKLTPARLKITPSELDAAKSRITPSLRDAIDVAQRNIADFARRSLRRTWSCKNKQGAIVGERFDPFERVGIYIPAGAAPLVSTALMTILLAREAGCREIVVCTPCGRQGAVNPHLLYAISKAGATEIYRVGGAQAIAALSYGTQTIRCVQKIFGPGNAYVVMAKRLLFGRVAVDLLPGPSELLVLADERAEARFIAADLLAQAEHGSGYERVWLVTPSARLIDAVKKEIGAQLPNALRRKYMETVLDRNTWLVQTSSRKEAIEICNRLAPEHCEIMMRSAGKIARRVLTAGAIFIGPWSPTVLGDYIAGPSHTLPTGGAGASFSGLSAEQFQRRTSTIRYSKSALRKTVKSLRLLADVEGLAGHKESALIRLRKTSAGQA